MDEADIHQADLRATVAALQTRIADLEAGEARRRQYLESVLACAPDAIVTFDDQHRILEWNRGAEHLFGYSAAEALNCDIDELLAGCDSSMLEQARGFTRHTLSQGSVPPTETVRFRRDGSAVDVMVAGEPILLNGQLLGAVAVYTDITARKQAEVKMQHRSRYLETLQSINSTLRTTLPLQEVLDTIVRGAGETLDYPGVLIVLPDEHGQRLLLGAAWGASFLSSAMRTLDLRLGRLSLPLAFEDNPMARAYREGQLLTWTGSPTQIVAGVEPAIAPAVTRLIRHTMGSKLAIYVPLPSGTRPMGVLVVFSRRPALDDEERRVLLGLADQAGLAIETARRFAEAEYLKAFNESIVQSMAEGIAVQDEQGRLVFMNAAALAMLGYTLEEIRGKPWTMVVPLDQQSIIQAADERRLLGQSDQYQVELLRRDGSRLPTVMSGRPRYDTAGRFVGTLAVFNDVSERMRAEAAAARRAREMAAMYETFLEINAQRDLPLLLRSIVQRAAELLGQRMGGLYLLEPDGETLKLVVSHQLPGRPVGALLRRGEGLSGRVAQSGQPLMVADYQSWEGRASIYEGLGFRRVLAVPLRAQNRVIGVIDVTDDQRTGLFDDEEVKLLSLFADQAALAIENARLIAESRRRAEELGGLYETAIATSGLLDTNVLMGRVYEQVQRLFAPDAVVVAMYEAERSEVYLLLTAEGGQRGHHPEVHVPVDAAGLIGLVIQSGRPLLIGDLDSDSLPAPSLRRGQRIRTWLGAPMIGMGGVIGAISVQAVQPHAFDEDHRRLLESVASQVAIALDNARLYGEAQQRLTALTVLFDGSAAISSSLDVERVLHTTAETMTTALGAEECAISLWDRETDDLVTMLDYAAVPVQPLDAPGARYHLAHFPATRRVLDTRQPIEISRDDPAADEAERALMAEQGSQQVLMIPLVVRDEAIGLIELIECSGPRTYTATEISLCQTLANQIAAALENARLFEAEHASRERAEALRQAAQAMGTSLEVDEILRLILEELRHVLVYDTASVLIYREANLLELVSGAGYEDGERTSRAAGRLLPASPILARMAEDLQPIVCDDVRQLPGWIWVPGAEHVRSWLALPLVAQGRMIGVLMADHRQPGFFRPADLQMVQALAQHATQAIEHARLFQAEREQRALAEALRRAAAAVSTTLDLSEVLDRILEQVSSVFAGDAANIMLIEAGMGRFVRWRGYDRFGAEHVLASIVFEVAATPSLQQTCQSSQPLVVPDTAGYPGWVRLPETAWVRSHAAAPIRVRDQVVGLLIIDSGTPDFFDASVAEPLQAFADSAGIAIGNARLYEETVRQNRELVVLNRVIAASAADQEVEAILEVACRELASALDMPVVNAIRLDETLTEVTTIAAYSAGGAALSRTSWRFPPEEQGKLRYLVDRQEPLVIPDMRAVEERVPAYDALLEEGVLALLAVPLIVSGRTVGAIALNAHRPRVFTAQEIDLVRRVADQLASALARASLAENQKRLSIAVEQAAESVMITDTAGKILYVNPAFEHTSGYRREEALGRTASIVKSGQHDRAFYERLWQVLHANEVWKGRLVNRRKDGSLYTEEATISPVHNQAGETVNYVAVKRDVTREVQLEEQFRQAQKMEAMGRLAGGIAHDFNNLLTVIQVSGWLLQRQIRPEDPLWEYVQRIQETVERATNLVKQLLSFSRRQIIQPQTLDLNHVVGDMGRMLQRIISEDVRLVTSLSPNIWPIHVDPSQLEQVIMNLVINARDAMPDGGTVTINTANVVLDEEYVAYHIGARPGEHVLLAIGDTGMGMTEEVKAHLFEPFFTTKVGGQGTGLGLSTVFGIVNQSQGHIWVDSAPDRGTTFKIYFPRALESKPVSQPRSLPIVQDARGTETILLVEDEAAVRELVVRVLNAHGYQVLAASQGSEALDLSRRHSGPIHLLLTDVIMPFMNGRELAERLLHERPDVRVLYFSGYTDDAIAQQGVLKPDTAFVSKPFDLAVLIHKVRSVLDAERRT